MTSANSASSWIKPSLDWLLIFVPIAIVLRFIPAFENPTALFIVASVLIAQQISSDGESNWVEGLQLLAVYTILGILFDYLPDAPHAVEALPNALPIKNG